MKVKFISYAILFVALLGFSRLPVFAQESEAVVIDEVVAQVNDGVITLSGVNKEVQNAVESLVQQGKKPEEAKAMVEKQKGEIIANLINEQLLLQKGKDLGLDADIDARINERFLQYMKEQNLKKIEDLYKAMNEAGVKPDEIREVWRKQIMRDTVFQREVDAKIYYGWGEKEIKDYFEKHKDTFTKPETVALSELFLGFAGRDLPTVKAKADDLVKQARSGADFTKLVVENSDRPDAAQTKGSVGTLPVTELNPKVAEAIKGVKAGDVGKFEVDEGIEIIHVDSRSESSKEAFFDENAVRGAMTNEKMPEGRKKYLADLRKDAYIKISDTYSPLVNPLFNDSASAAAPPAKKTSK